ncbi:THAP domain-containing protein 2-like [Myripristis murdjan]|uniref:THAP domain-containing protein 2-like n=1 Tax=Myripristis murdjan TaxID=586833 RepID=UPI001176123E|nr:THAP domain-containing protein 2-like [Myripristis murdjan]XP_029919573.1 THAP domain-containing protein 2-like [Myripristis murdjan]
MPAHCAAHGCTNRRNTDTRQQGITFHRFPRDGGCRRRWERALRRAGFAASDESVLCSQHFRTSDFDRTGQTVRIRPDVIPSVFNFPDRHQRPETTRTTATSRRAEQSLQADISPNAPEKQQQPNVELDHNYSLPCSPAALKAKLSEASARVLSLEKEKRNAQVRERRAKHVINALLTDLREKNLLNKELNERLQSYSDLPLDLFKKRKQNKSSKKRPQHRHVDAEDS